MQLCGYLIRLWNLSLLCWLITQFSLSPIEVGFCLLGLKLDLPESKLVGKLVRGFEKGISQWIFCHYWKTDKLTITQWHNQGFPATCDCELLMDTWIWHFTVLVQLSERKQLGSYSWSHLLSTPAIISSFYPQYLKLVRFVGKFAAITGIHKNFICNSLL